jgi:hypothetical protein
MTKKIYIRRKENRQDSDVLPRPPRCLEAFTLKVIEIYRFHDERRERHIGQRFIFILDSGETTQTVYQHVRRFIVTVRVMMRQKFGETKLVNPVGDYYRVLVKIVKIFMPIDLGWYTNDQRPEHAIASLKSCHQK